MFVFIYLDPRKDDNRSIQKKTKQLVDIVEQRNALVELLDEERKRFVGLWRGGGGAFPPLLVSEIVVFNFLQ